MTTKKISQIAFVLVLIVFFGSAIRMLGTEPDEGKTALHFYYESSFGPSSAILSIFSFVIMLKLVRRLKDKTKEKAMKMFAASAFMIFIGMGAFGIHGWGLIEGEPTRYILRTSIFIGSIFTILGVHFWDKSLTPIEQAKSTTEI